MLCPGDDAPLTQRLVQGLVARAARGANLRAIGVHVVIERPGAPARHNLYHLGNLVFLPTGVPSATIAFAREGAKITRLTVADPNVMLTAGRE